MFKNANLIVVGSGLFGSIIAERASRSGYKVVVVEQRDHIGGNCYTEFDKETGINVHKYGPHIFHTNNDQVWGYITQFTEFNNYCHSTRSQIGDKTYPFPLNLESINKFFGTNFKPEEAKQWLKELQSGFIEEPTNFEEQAISLVGPALYNAFFRGYTIKQWERDPKELPASVARRIPIHTNYSTNYYATNEKYQGIPVDGYTPIFERMLDHKNIEVLLNTRWELIKDQVAPNQLVVYTGPIDAYFEYCYGQLNWRTLDFEYRTEPVSDYHGCTSVNFPEQSVPWTREVEHRHFHPERQTVPNKTIIGREFSRSATKDDVPYYPVKTAEDIEMFNQYWDLANKEINVIFGGRLGEYMYYDMHQVIGSALAKWKNKIEVKLEQINTTSNNTLE